MNRELERLKDYITSRPVTRYERSALEEHRYVEIDTIAITQIVNYIDNSIPKEVIEKHIESYQKQYKEIISKYDDYQKGKAIINVTSATDRAKLDRVSNGIDILQELLDKE